MPCLSGRSKHNLCKPKTCSDEELCPCTPTDAFSVQLGGDEKDCCCCPAEAFGRINLTSFPGITGFETVGLVTGISNKGIAEVSGGEAEGTTGVWTVAFDKNLFNSCPGDLPPSIQLTPCNFTGVAEILSTICVDVSNDSVTVINSIAPNDFSTPAVASDIGAFDIHAIQAKRC